MEARWSRGAAVVLAVLAGPAWTRDAAGQAVRNGSQFQVNTYTTGTQFGALVTAGLGGDFVVAWASPGAPGQPSEYFRSQARPFPAQGPPSIEPVSPLSGGLQSWPAGVAIADDGRFVAVSSGYTPPPALQREGWGTRFAGDGAPLGDPFQLLSDELPGDLAADPSGGFVLVWPKSVGPDSLQARRFLTDGTPAGDPIQVNTYAASPRAPRIAATRGADFVVVWWQSAPAGGNDVDGFSVQGRSFTAGGTPNGPQFQVNTYTTGLQWRPDVAIDESGSFVVVWQSSGSSGSDTSGSSVHARRFDADGTAHPEFQVNFYTTGEQVYPAVAMDAAGDFVIVWAGDGSLGGDDSGSSVHARRFDAGGAPRGGEFLVNSYTTGDQDAPDVAMDPAGNFVVVWQSDGSPEDDSSEASVQGQRFDALFRDSFEAGDSSRWSSTTS